MEAVPIVHGGGNHDRLVNPVQGEAPSGNDHPERRFTLPLDRTNYISASSEPDSASLLIGKSESLRHSPTLDRSFVTCV